jgi:hypothetical protein
MSRAFFVVATLLLFFFVMFVTFDLILILMDNTMLSIVSLS